MQSNTKSSSRSSRKVNGLVAILVVVLLLVAGAGTYFYMQYRDLKDSANVSQEAADAKAQKIKDKVAKLMVVPADELPTLATIDDVEKLKDQPFFDGAQNGDTLLLFPQARRAIIYREGENRLINVGPIAISTDSSSGTSEEDK